jgi:hypothetical protein
VRRRPIIHIAGPAGAGKTTLIERLLGAEVAFAISVRAHREEKRRREGESAPGKHAELRRYRNAGASAVALYRFGAPDTDAFYSSEVMEEYSEAVFIEGDCPVEFADLSVFVAPPPARGKSLLERVVRDHSAAHKASIQQFERALASPEAAARLLGAGLGEPFLAMALARPKILETVHASMQAKLEEIRRAPPPPPTQHWALGKGYAGIERVQLVVVNVPCGAGREGGEQLLADIARLRRDEEVYRDVIGLAGNRVPITAVLADLRNPRDPGLRKALARVRRVMRLRDR